MAGAYPALLPGGWKVCIRVHRQPVAPARHGPRTGCRVGHAATRTETGGMWCPASKPRHRRIWDGAGHERFLATQSGGALPRRSGIRMEGWLAGSLRCSRVDLWHVEAQAGVAAESRGDGAVDRKLGTATYRGRTHRDRARAVAHLGWADERGCPWNDSYSGSFDARARGSARGVRRRPADG